MQTSSSLLLSRQSLPPYPYSSSSPTNRPPSSSPISSHHPLRTTALISSSAASSSSSSSPHYCCPFSATPVRVRQGDRQRPQHIVAIPTAALASSSFACHVSEVAGSGFVFPEEEYSEKWDSDKYEALLKGGEQVTSVLQEMVKLLENVEMDEASEAAAVEIAAQGVIGKRVDEMEAGFMMALDYMIQLADKDQDDQRKSLLEVIKQTVLDHLTKKCPPHVQVIGLLCRTPGKDSRHELLRRVAAGGGVFKSEKGDKVHLPGANLSDIANQADDLLETMESRTSIPDRKLLARLVLIREEARSMMGGGILDERNNRGLNTLPEAEVNFLVKLVALKPGKIAQAMIKNVMLGKDEGAEISDSDDESSKQQRMSSGGIAGRGSITGRKPRPVRPGMFLETVSKESEAAEEEGRRGREGGGGAGGGPKRSPTGIIDSAPLSPPHALEPLVWPLQAAASSSQFGSPPIGSDPAGHLARQISLCLDGAASTVASHPLQQQPPPQSHKYTPTLTNIHCTWKSGIPWLPDPLLGPTVQAAPHPHSPGLQAPPFPPSLPAAPARLPIEAQAGGAEINTSCSLVDAYRPLAGFQEETHDGEDGGVAAGAQVLGGVYSGNVSGMTVQHLEWVHEKTLQILQEMAHIRLHSAAKPAVGNDAIVKETQLATRQADSQWMGADIHKPLSEILQGVGTQSTITLQEGFFFLAFRLAVAWQVHHSGTATSPGSFSSSTSDYAPSLSLPNESHTYTTSCHIIALL
ncbi:hypothetical protein Taro_028364 [Colocasia esculenta]|uniref:Protein PEP-RELATED DEVELOPMENT ARRESTED 1, chloroplastic n=1 Tax=Colocasia esculenta TaxID=4460 RepID=A0A843VQ81_COLES|nr:hypothetical protein [Colocasia esculenta]